MFIKYCTKMYPKALICRGPLSDFSSDAALPQVFESSGCPPVPNPILELWLLQYHLPLLLPTIPILAFAHFFLTDMALKPSLTQSNCKEACDPISFFHVSRLNKVLRGFPSAISEYKESACLLITMNLSCCPIFIPRQILEKEVFQ